MSNQANVVVGYDFSASGREALFRALALAARSPSHVLHFVCVIEPHRGLPAVAADGAIDFRYADKVQAAVADIVGQDLRATNTSDRVHFFVHARIGKPADEILAVAREIGADLIIVGTRGLTGVERLVLGSVAERVVREAGCTVEVARPKAYPNVELLAITDAPSHHRPYKRPHRYSYDSTIAQLRPSDFPLY